MGFFAKTGSFKIKYQNQELQLLQGQPLALNQSGKFIPIQKINIELISEEALEIHRPEGTEPIELRWKSDQGDFYHVDLCENPDCKAFILRKPLFKAPNRSP